MTLDFKKKLVYAPFNFVLPLEVFMQPAPVPANDYTAPTLLSESEKSPLLQYSANRVGSEIVCLPSHHLNSQNDTAKKSGAPSLQGNQSRDNNLRLFRVKIDWDLDGAFLV